MKTKHILAICLAICCVIIIRQSLGTQKQVQPPRTMSDAEMVEEIKKCLVDKTGFVFDGETSDQRYSRQGTTVQSGIQTLDGHVHLFLIEKGPVDEEYFSVNDKTRNVSFSFSNGGIEKATKYGGFFDANSREGFKKDPVAWTKVVHESLTVIHQSIKK